ncbi:hypothetical protein DXG01_013730, partial [Tephrocybe rancida]
EIDPYNKDGSISVWNGKPQILSGHSAYKRDFDASSGSFQPIKYYTVNDVKFDPCSSMMVSAGNDKTIHIWMLDEETKLYEEPSYCSPVVEMPPIYLSSSQRKKDHPVGAMVWGRGPTAEYLFASSEPNDSTKFIGFHKAIDAETWRVSYTFDEDGAGDEITVPNDGSRLALITRREERGHSLRIYDIRRSDPNAQLSMDLESFPAGIEGEISKAAFSSDGIYLAMGRNDNHTHVYDSRYLDRLLFDYEHHGPPRTNPGGDSYGVVKVQWVDEDSVLPFGLITGGNDGCVRFWDPTQNRANSVNGTVLAEINSDVATFSIGDRYKEEHTLVVKTYQELKTTRRGVKCIPVGAWRRWSAIGDGNCSRAQIQK